MNERIEALEKQIHDLKQQLSEARRNAEPQPVQDHVLKTTDGADVRLSELFEDKSDLLVVHNMGKSCPYCMLWADGLNGFTGHLNSRAAFVLCSADDAPTAREFAKSRGWRFRVVAGKGSDFAKAMGYERDGKVWPGVSAFHKQDDGTIVRTGTAVFGPGDDFCSVWPLFDLLQDGPAGWAPKYAYA